MKALFLYDIIDGKQCFNIFAITFEIILSKTLHNDIGLRSAVVYSCLILGMRQTRVRFRPVESFPVSKNTLQTWTISAHTILQYVWKKSRI